MTEPGRDMIIEELSQTECLRLLTNHRMGRVAVVVNNQPVILPVNYRIDDGTVVFRTDAGTKLRGAPMAWVAFEIDEIDQANHEGWSVLVAGVGQDITDTVDARSEELRVLAVSPWAPGDKAYWIKVVPRRISGRSLRHRLPTDPVQ